MDLTRILLDGIDSPPIHLRRPAPGNFSGPRSHIPIKRRMAEAPSIRRGLRATLEEGVRSGDMVTLTLHEARAVLRLIKESEKDPFTYRSGNIDTDDLQSVGLQVQDNEDDTGGDDFQEPVAASHSGGRMLSPSVAVTAPDATPTMGDDAPPPEIEAALQAFNDPDESSPGAAPTSPGKDYDAIARALIGGSGPELDDEDNGLPPPVPTSGTFESSAHADPSVAPAGNIVKGLKEAREKAKKEKLRKLQEKRR